MFDFLRKSSAQQPLPEPLIRALQASGLPPETDLARLGVVESSGRYAGRLVTFIRIFDPVGAARRSINVASRRAYGDLEANPDLVLRSGHIEADGTIVLATPPPAEDRPVPDRSLGDPALRTQA